VDAQVGRVLDALDRLGLADRTIIVFTSDHGYHLGDHGLWQKYSLFERSARVPLIIAGPTLKAGGRAAPGLVEMIDLYPTLAGLCGLAGPEYLDGADLRPMLDDPSRSVKEAAFSQIKRGDIEGFSVRTERWRYTEWNAGGRQDAQLFDEEADPGETKNVVNEPGNAETIAALRWRLEPIRAQK
jgi:uncharacterized sulfatase